MFVLHVCVTQSNVTQSKRPPPQGTHIKASIYECTESQALLVWLLGLHSFKDSHALMNKTYNIYIHYLVE